jgi:geranylgeranyl pyrophosphate synthase
MQKDPNLASLIEGGADVAEVDVLRIKELIRDCGALDEAKSISRQHGEEAKELISLTEMDQDTKGSLIALINYVEGSLDWYR